MSAAGRWVTAGPLSTTNAVGRHPHPEPHVLLDQWKPAVV
jgi:hypothetical protein